MSVGHRVAAIFDLDYTITRRDTYRSFLIRILSKQPMRLFRSAWLPIALILYGISLRDNSWLKKAFLGTIVGGSTRIQVDCWVEESLVQLLDTGIRPGALQTIRRHRDAGYHLVLVTASFDFYAEKLGKHLGFDKVICTRSVWDNTNKLIGELDGRNCYGPIKVARLAAYFGEQRDQWYIVGYTDHHSDLPLLKWVDKAVAVNPTKKLFEIATQSGYEIKDWEKP